MAIVKRLVKGSALTHAELDANFTDLDARSTATDAEIGLVNAELLDLAAATAVLSGSDPLQPVGKHFVSDGAGGGAWEYDPCGWGHYKDNSGAQVFGTTDTQLTINAAGAETEEAYLPREIRGSATLWDTLTSAVTPVALGDSFTLRIDIPVTSEGGNPAELVLQIDIGDNSTPYVIVEQTIPTGKTVPYTVSVSIPLFAGSTFIANGARIFMHTNAGTVTVTNPAITIIRTSGN